MSLMNDPLTNPTKKNTKTRSQFVYSPYQVREEKKLANEMGIRYKNALERSKPSTAKDPSATNNQVKGQ